MKKIICIGGSRGIGLSTIKMLLNDQHEIFLFSKSMPDNELLKNPLLKFYQYDANEHFPLEMIPEVIDGYIYFLGTINLRPFERLSADEFIHDYKINVLNNINILQQLIKKLKKSTLNPSCVFFSTVAVAQGMPFHSSIAASKGAIEGLTRSLAAEFSPTIRFNCISPSLTKTPLSEKITGNPKMAEASAQKHPLKRIGDPEDLAKVVRFLISDDSSWITGQNIHCDGGISSIKL